MAAFIEVWRSGLPDVVALASDETTIGKSEDNAVVIAWDATVSRVHAVLRRIGPAWSIEDLGSRNGTAVNGETLVGRRALHPGDEVRVGETRIVFRDDGRLDAASVTHAAQAAPDVTRREREVLVALCRPVLEGNITTGPAAVDEIAAELVITTSAVKKHLVNLYDKFEIHDDERRRRGRLASEAIRRGAVSRADLTSASP